MFSTSEIRCNLCGQNKADKYRKTEKGYQPYKCPNCGKVLPEGFDTLYFKGRLSAQDVHSILQSQAEASSLCAVSRISRLAYDTVASLIQAVSQKLQNKLKYLSNISLSRRPMVMAFKKIKLQISTWING